MKEGTSKWTTCKLKHKRALELIAYLLGVVVAKRVIYINILIVDVAA